MPQIGETRYFVEYLDHAKGLKAIADGGGDTEYDTMWDFCSQEEIEEVVAFQTKQAAVKWAKKYSSIDVFNMPRIREETYQEIPEDEIHDAIEDWVQTGYWEAEGKTPIEEYNP